MEIFLTQDGSSSVMHPDLGISFHSKYGAITESNHVFIGNGLDFIEDKANTLKILEVGLGTGLNLLLTFLRRDNVIYHALEPYPLEPYILERLNYNNFMINPDKASEIFKIAAECIWNQEITLSENFKFLKYKLKLEDFKNDSQYHLIYFDTFAPSAQPELWTEEILTKVYNFLLPGGILVTYCAKGSVKRIFKNLGALVQSPSGPPGKREMTRVIKPLSV
jgi:tRNA U34 5-methylaminomethyl-2-thiouridine-forming methyltransferase MnmC